MNEAQALVSRLQDVSERILLQEQPYPVAAPRSIEQAVSCLHAARDEGYTVMVLGSGSSFPPGFSLLRERLLAVMTVRLSGTQAISPFAIRVLGGSPVAGIIIGANGANRTTVGGLIAGARTDLTDPVFRSVWLRTQAVEILSCDGEVLMFAGPARTGCHDGAAAGLLIGSRGRLGMITAVELTPPLPLHPMDRAGSGSGDLGFGAIGGESVLSAGEVRLAMDRRGLFQW